MESTKTARATAAAISLATAAAIGAFLAAAVQPGCSAKRCDYNVKEPDKPVVSVQCPAGEVCYQGDCRRACEPARETAAANPCNSNADCQNPALPNCVSGAAFGDTHCSACEPADVCVIGVGICEPVVEIPTPPEPMPTTVPPPDLPLDGGYIDGNVFGRGDAGEAPAPQAVTHVGTVEISQRADFTAGPRRDYPVVGVNFFDVRTGTVAQERMTLGELRQCELGVPTTYSTGIPADVGDVRITPDGPTPDALNGVMMLSATFDPMTSRYRVMPAMVPNPLLHFSEHPAGGRFLDVFSPGESLVTEPWPDPAIAYHVPFVFEPTQATIDLLSAPIIITDPPQDLTFQWAGVPASVGAVGGEKVNVEVVGGALYLRCIEIEGFATSTDTIVIPSEIMGMYRSLDMIGAGVERTIVVERVFEQTLPIAGEPGTGVVVDGTLVISHTFLGTLRF